MLMNLWLLVKLLLWIGMLKIAASVQYDIFSTNNTQDFPLIWRAGTEDSLGLAEEG